MALAEASAPRSIYLISNNYFKPYCFFEDAIEDTFSNQDFARSACKNLSDITSLLHVSWKNKFIAAIDEFRYFHRKALAAFLSHLQYNIDINRSNNIDGGLFALGSIHTEMMAV